MTSSEALKKLIPLKNQKIPIEKRYGGDGYVGRWVEDFLGIEENNRDSSDLEDKELKTHNEDVNSKITGFNKSPSGRGKSRQIFEACSYDTEEGRKFNAAINTKRISNIKGYGYGLTEDDGLEEEGGFRFFSTDPNNPITAKWEYSKIKKTFNRKMNKGLLIVNYRTGEENGKSYFYITSIVECTDPDSDKFIDLIRKGNVDIEFRFGQYLTGKNAGKMHNHGIAFRINESKVPEIFSEVIYH